MKKILFVLITLTATMAVSATTFTKVTAEPLDWSGQYLIVYENSTSEAFVFNGEDTANDYVSAPTENGVITSDNLNACVITILAGSEGDYFLKIGNQYIAGKNDANGLSFSAAAAGMANTLALQDGSVMITSNTSVLRFNNAEGQKRFRYYKATSYANQQVIQLYKANTNVVDPEPTTSECLFDTISVSEAIARIENNQLCACIVKGRVKSIITTDANIDTYGNVDMWIEDATNPNDTLKAFRLNKGANSLKFTNRADLDALFAVGDVIYMYANALMFYTDTKTGTTFAEINTGYFFKKDGASVPVWIPCVLDTVSVTEAIALIATNDTCPHVVKGRVLSITEVETQYGNTTVWLADETNEGDSIMAYRMFKGPNGEKFANTLDVPFFVGDIIYVYGGKLILYRDIPELSATNNVYYFGREGISNRVELDFEQVAVEHDLGCVVNFGKPGDSSLAFSYMITLADDEAICGSYDVVDASLTYQGTPVPVSGSIVITTDSMVDNEIYYQIALHLVDDNGVHYVQPMGLFHSADYPNDNRNITAALAYEIGMGLEIGAYTNAFYNVYGYATGDYAKSGGKYQYWDATYRNHSFYISDVLGATRGFFEGYRVGPTSGNAADTAKLGDYIVFKGVQIKNYNGIPENNATAKYDKVISAPLLRDVEAPEISVSEALTIEPLTATYQLSKKYYTVCGLVVEDEANNHFYMVQGNDTVIAFRCLSTDGQIVKRGDYVKVRAVLQYYGGHIYCYYGQVVYKQSASEAHTGEYRVLYIDKDDAVLSSQSVSLNLPDAPAFFGFTFAGWDVVAGHLENGIIIRAVYTYDGDISTSAPEMVVNPNNPAQKLIREGNIYILREGERYDISGRKY